MAAIRAALPLALGRFSYQTPFTICDSVISAPTGATTPRLFLLARKLFALPRAGAAFKPLAATFLFRFSQTLPSRFKMRAMMTTASVWTTFCCRGAQRLNLALAKTPAISSEIAGVLALVEQLRYHAKTQETPASLAFCANRPRKSPKTAAYSGFKCLRSSSSSSSTLCLSESSIEPSR